MNSISDSSLIISFRFSGGLGTFSYFILLKFSYQLKSIIYIYKLHTTNQ